MKIPMENKKNDFFVNKLSNLFANCSMDSKQTKFSEVKSVEINCLLKAMPIKVVVVFHGQH